METMLLHAFLQGDMLLCVRGQRRPRRDRPSPAWASKSSAAPFPSIHCPKPGAMDKDSNADVIFKALL